MKQREEKKKGKSTVGTILTVVIAVLIGCSELAEESLESVIAVILGLVPLIAVITIVILLVKKRKKAAEKPAAAPAGRVSAPKMAGRGGAEHSHDRLSSNTLASESEDGFDHYRRQLEGFLKAGLIDKAEYRVLYEKYRKQLEA